MAKHPVTTVTWSCDLCGKSFPNDEELITIKLANDGECHICADCNPHYKFLTDRLVEMVKRARAYAPSAAQRYYRENSSYFDGENYLKGYGG